MPARHILRIRRCEAGEVESDVYDHSCEQAIGGGNIVVHTGKQVTVDGQNLTARLSL